MKALICSALVVAFLVSCQERPEYPQRQPPAGFLQNPAQQAAGKSIFAKKCAWCHGSLDEGRNPRINDIYPGIATFREPKYARIDPAYLFWRIARGKQVEPYRSRGSIMPAWGPYFSDETIWQLVAYIRIRPVPEKAPRQRG